MQTILFILIILFALGALFALIRGIVAFLRTTDEELRRDGVVLADPGVGRARRSQNAPLPT